MGASGDRPSRGTSAALLALGAAASALLALVVFDGSGDSERAVAVQEQRTDSAAGRAWPSTDRDVSPPAAAASDDRPAAVRAELVVSGRVVTPDGFTLAGAQVAASASETGAPFASTETD
ncbi:MAG: hypothetical protein AAFZ65_17345, partial [Planctomycetota bacterium]